MQIIINGQNKEITTGVSIAGTIALFAKTKTHLIAELNGNIIPTEKWEATTLKQGDALELVAFVGGG